MTAALHPDKHDSDWVSSYSHYERFLKAKDIQFPMRHNQIPKFEKFNALSLNLYTLEKIGKLKHEVVPVCLPTSDLKKTVNLLILHSKEKNQGKDLVESDEMDIDEVKKIRAPMNYHYM